MINGQWAMSNDKRRLKMTTRETIDIQKRTFDFGVRIIKFVDRLPRTLAGMEIVN